MIYKILYNYTMPIYSVYGGIVGYFTIFCYNNRIENHNQIRTYFIYLCNSIL